MATVATVADEANVAAPMSLEVDGEMGVATAMDAENTTDPMRKNSGAAKRKKRKSAAQLKKSGSADDNGFTGGSTEDLAELLSAEERDSMQEIIRTSVDLSSVTGGQATTGTSGFAAAAEVVKRAMSVNNFLVAAKGAAAAAAAAAKTPAKGNSGIGLAGGISVEAATPETAASTTNTVDCRRDFE